MGNPFVSDPSLGPLSPANITAPTLVAGKSSFLSSISILVAGSASGTINDASSVAAAQADSTTAKIALPMTAGIIPARWSFNNGIVVLPGTGQTIAVTFAE